MLLISVVVRKLNIVLETWGRSRASAHPISVIHPSIICPCSAITFCEAWSLSHRTLGERQGQCALISLLLFICSSLTDAANVWTTECAEEAVNLPVSLNRGPWGVSPIFCTTLWSSTSYLCLETDVCSEIYRGSDPKTQVRFLLFFSGGQG